jgi:prolycopene isomerase
MVVGPHFSRAGSSYDEMKVGEMKRILGILEKRFPSFEENLIYKELATSDTIERFTMKPGGAAAGPKQKMGQHMFMRQHVNTNLDGLYCCGEGCAMGTGTPAVTTSAIAAANCILKKMSYEPYVYKSEMNNHINVLKTPVPNNWISSIYPPQEAEIMLNASKCLYCLNPECCPKEFIDIPSIMRRASCANFAGAIKQLKNSSELITEEFLTECENHCVRFASGEAVDIKGIFLSILLLKTS